MRRKLNFFYIAVLLISGIASPDFSRAEGGESPAPADTSDFAGYDTKRLISFALHVLRNPFPYIPCSLSQTPPVAEFNMTVKWRAGTPTCEPGSEPPYQVHYPTPDTVIIRQSKCLNYEAPFIHLVLGTEKALMIDTGAVGGAEAERLRDMVNNILKDFAERNKLKKPPELVVSHSHAHGDHCAGDDVFKDNPNTTLIGKDPQSVAAHFGIADWPKGTGKLNLGGRQLDILPIPGHEPSSIAIYDRKYEILYTGDTVYPGRLYVDDFHEFRTSIGRMKQFADENPVKHILGAHIEMSNTPGRDFPAGSKYHPDEHPLELGIDHLRELDRISKTMTALRPVRRHDSFIVKVHNSQQIHKCEHDHKH